MPELPEVEVVRRGLARWAVGSTVDEVEVLEPRAVRRHPGGADSLRQQLRGATLVAARRRGKYCWLETHDGRALVVHLGMSGQMLLQPPDAPAERHLRVRLGLTGGPPAREGRHLRFVDQRMFGGLLVSPLVPDGAADARLAQVAAPRPVRARPASAVPAPVRPPLPAESDEAYAGTRVPGTVGHVARDLLDPELDLDRLAERLRTRRTGVKRALLDQTLVSGVGNIYADEALHRAGVHGERPCRGLPRAVLVTILVAGAQVMTEALAAGGTSFDSLYVDVNGSSGWFERSLAVYGRAGRPCRTCGAPVARSSFMNRSSYWCPRCQVAPRPAG